MKLDDIPDDIMFSILKRLLLSRADLISFSQVAKRYWTPCQECLFEEVDLSHKNDDVVENQFRCMQKAVKRCGLEIEDMTKVTRTLRIGLGWGEPSGLLGIPEFIPFLFSFGNLQSLTVSCMDLSEADSLLLSSLWWIISSPTMLQLNLEKLSGVPPPLIRSALRVPSLTMEACYGLYSSNNSTGQADADVPLPALRSSVTQSFCWSGSMEGLKGHLKAHRKMFSSVQTLQVFQRMGSGYQIFELGQFLNSFGNLRELRFIYPLLSEASTQSPNYSVTHDVLTSLTHPHSAKLERLAIRFHVSDKALAVQSVPLHKFLWGLAEILGHPISFPLLEEMVLHIVFTTPITHCAKKLQDDAGDSSQTLRRLDEIVSSRDSFPRLKVLRWIFVRDRYLEEVKFDIPVCRRIIEGSIKGNMPKMNERGCLSLDFVSKVDKSWVWCDQLL